MIVWAALILGVFWVVVTRQKSAWQTQKRLVQLQLDLDALIAQRDALEAEVATARSLPVLGPKARNLGLRDPTDQELRQLTIIPRQ